MDNPETFFRQNISSTATVSTSLSYLHPNYIVGTSEGVFLFFHNEHHPLESAEIAQGDRIYFRGTIINNSVSVHEFYLLDASSSIIRSIPKRLSTSRLASAPNLVLNSGDCKSADMALGAT